MSKNDIKSIFGKYVFDDDKMKKYLSKEAYLDFKNNLKSNKELSEKTAKNMAEAMCRWATDMGATQYTHWFQPLTDATCEKRESFIAFDNNNKPIAKLSGRELIKGETDGSSFPTGGIRQTFEARGYTVWDKTSPCFIRDDETGVTLCIPTAFYSWTGEALDKKSVLMRSMEAISEEGVKLLNVFGLSDVKKVFSMLGPEQEYFLIDREEYLKRKDLIYTGRTLFGAMPPKGQEMDDHYYGSIRSKIGAFMDEVNHELWALGVPAKTSHNEVAPAQHEVAVLYEKANIACDNNCLVMEILRKVASRYDMICLLHEKPFDKLNGSGKHNNWSIQTDKGLNLLSPGDDPQKNLLFLLILTLVIKAVDENADILRSSASNVGNDRRLGGNEAPPTIISIFLGEQLTGIVEHIIYGKENSIKGRQIIETGSSAIPNLYKDVTDRNRTSPFAFTGNKFEFRMVGSSDSCAMPIATINTIVAKAFKEATEYFAKKGIKNKKQTTSKISYDKKFEKEILDYIKDILKEHYRIVFNGNGYGQEWQEEAKKRGLSVVANMVEAIDVMNSKKNKELFTSMKVMTESEINSRVEVCYETYVKTIKIEILTMINIVKKQILPACLEYKGKLLDNIKTIKDIDTAITYDAELGILTELDKKINAIREALVDMEKEFNECEGKADMSARAKAYSNNLIKKMDGLRSNVDALEMLVDKKYWPLPSYGDLIFEVSAI